MFENIIGNDKIKQELKHAVDLNINSHSYLFIGTDGIGKKLIAKEFAKMLLCNPNAVNNEENNKNDTLIEKKDNGYCNKCKSCIEFSSNNNPDFFFIEPDGNSIKIEQIREMQRKIIEEPIISIRKVYIIDDSDKMTKEAQNALLKTLEEPPKFVVIILIASNENLLLTTIKSRCNIIRFNNIPDDEIKKYLEEKYNITNLETNMIKSFGGSIGKAEILREKQELYSHIYNSIDKIEKLDLIDMLKEADIIYKSQDDKFEILEYINVILFEKSKTNMNYLKGIDIVEETKKRLKANSNYNMCIDNMLFSLWEEINFEKYSRN